MDFGLKGRTALVTGGSRGLGNAICMSLAQEGANIAINYKNNMEKANLLASEIKDRYGVSAITVQGNIDCEEDVKHIFREVSDQFSSLDILVNNAGICPVSMVKDMTLEEWNNNQGNTRKYCEYSLPGCIQWVENRKVPLLCQ